MNFNTIFNWDTRSWKEMKNRATNFISWEGSTCWRHTYLKFILGRQELIFLCLVKFDRYLFGFTNLPKDWLSGVSVSILRNDIQTYLINLRGPKSFQITEKDNRTPNGRKSGTMRPRFANLAKKVLLVNDIVDFETHSGWEFAWPGIDEQRKSHNILRLMHLAVEYLLSRRYKHNR